MNAFDPPQQLWPPRQRAHYPHQYYQPAPHYPYQDQDALYPTKTELPITSPSALYSPKTESPITPTDAAPFDAPALSERVFLPPGHTHTHTLDLAPAPRYEKPPPFLPAPAYPRFPAQDDYFPTPPDQSPSSEISDPWGYDNPPQPPPAPLHRYPNLGTRDTAAFDEYGRHFPLRRHAFLPRHDPHAYRRPEPSPPPPEHQLKETHSIPAETLDSLFTTVGANGAGGRRAWVCQQCSKSVRKQDRAAHMLSHQGKKRYDCRCGKRFGRPQDADRHIREQAPCQTCEGKMGRYGKDGKCSTCVLELEHGVAA